MKNKIKKLKLPLNKMTGNEKDYVAVLLEDVNSNMKAFWEVLSGVKEKGDATFEQVGAITERLDTVEAGQATTNRIVNSMSTRLDSIESLQEVTNTRLDSIESLQEVTNTRLDSMENLQEVTNKRLDSIESLQEVTNTRLDSIDVKTDNINKEKVDPRRFLELEKKVINIESKIKVNAF